VQQLAGAFYGVPSKKAPLGLPGSVVVVGGAVVVVGAAVVVVGAAVVVVGAAVVVVGAAVVVVGAAVVVVGAAVVVVVSSHTKDPPGDVGWHASQQLAAEPTQACPSRGGRHLSAPRLIEHLTLPRRSMRQQVTRPGLPHVDFAAQRVTSPLHSCGSAPVDASVFATSLTHFTYWP
jgi:hypothetical protein